MAKTIKITQAQLDDICDAAQIDYEAVDKFYSGRAMYGAKCIGVTGTPGDGISFGIALAVVLPEGDEDARDDMLQQIYAIVRNTRTDSMGRDMITYWPGLEFDGPEEKFEEGDED
jgi:hypothetical protein